MVEYFIFEQFQQLVSNPSFHGASEISTLTSVGFRRISTHGSWLLGVLLPGFVEK